MQTTTELLAQLRARGIRNSDMARALSVKPSAITELYAGKRSLKLDEAAKLVASFGLDDDLIAQPSVISLANRVAANIQRLREAKSLSRPELGERCRPPTSGQQIEKLEKGQRGLSLEWVERVAAGLKVSATELITGSPEGRGTSMEVAAEVARTLATVSLDGRSPSDATVQKLAIVIDDLTDLFARHPEARHTIDIARPAIDLIARRRPAIGREQA